MAVLLYYGERGQEFPNDEDIRRCQTEYVLRSLGLKRLNMMKKIKRIIGSILLILFVGILMKISIFRYGVVVALKSWGLAIVLTMLEYAALHLLIDP